MIPKPRGAILCAAALFSSGSFAMAEIDFRGTLRSELYIFKDSPLSAIQTQDQTRIELDLAAKFAASETLSFAFDGTFAVGDFPFKRIERLSADYNLGSTNVSFGYRTELWAKSEFARLSNVINARDYRVDPSGETMVGQPMLTWSAPLGPGTLTAIAMYQPKQNIFATAKSRLRGVLPVAGDPLFEKSKKKTAYALRYEANIGISDIGFYGYIGPSREAALVQNGASVSPYYAWVKQVGIDAQLTYGAAVGKFEIRHTQSQLDRTGARTDGFAASIGAEYAFYGVFASSSDITTAIEYAWDQRGPQAWQTAQNDLFVGARWSLQNIADTQFEIGFQKDFDFDTTALRFGFKHRIADGFTVKTEAMLWRDTDPADLAFGLSQDSHVRMTLEMSF